MDGDTRLTTPISQFAAVKVVEAAERVVKIGPVWVDYDREILNMVELSEAIEGLRAALDNFERANKGDNKSQFGWLRKLVKR